MPASRAKRRHLNVSRSGDSNVSAPTYADCQGGLGYEKPVTNFQVRGGKVSRIIAISFAD